MAPVDDDSRPLATYLDQEVPKLITKYDKLWEFTDPEETPYKSKYEARKLLESMVKQVEHLLSETTEAADAERGREMLARLFLFMGKNLYFCEEVPKAEKYFNMSLERYLRSKFRLEPLYFVQIQDAFNQLGMLWCNRHGFREGMNFLRRAQIMFLNRPQAVRDQQEQRAEDNYTLTMFFLAQAYGALQKPGLSARFCAATLSRQLEYNAPGQRSQEVRERDPFDCKDWVRNCCAMSDYFVNACMFWTAEYLLHAALAMCERCKAICGIRPENLEELQAECKRDLGAVYAARLRFMRSCVEYPDHAVEVWRGALKKPVALEGGGEGSRLSFRCSADGVAGTETQSNTEEEPIVWDAVFHEVVQLEDEEAHDNRMAEEEEEAASEPHVENVSASGKEDWLELQPGHRVRLPVYFRCLHDIAERRMQRANASFFVLRKQQLEVSPGSASSVAAPRCEDDTAEKLPTYAATVFEAAREVFKLANRYQTMALAYFQLDGWVSEHVRILQELSKMYRNVIFWEKDRKRVAAIEMRRARMLAPLLDVLNPKVFLAFWRQLSFECAEIYQELFELKGLGKLPGGQSPFQVDDADDDQEDLSVTSDVRRVARHNELVRKSLRYYTIFVDSYKQQDQSDPKRVEEDHTRSYLIGRLSRARLRTKMRGLSLDDDIEEHKQSLRDYEYILDYGKRNHEVIVKPDVNMAKELLLCNEMATMLRTKLSSMAAKRHR